MCIFIYIALPSFDVVDSSRVSIISLPIFSTPHPCSCLTGIITCHNNIVGTIRRGDNTSGVDGVVV